MSVDHRGLLELASAAAVEAGAAILRVYAGDFAVAQKADASPVTRADQLAEAIILATLGAATPDIPVIAEERAAAYGLPGAAPPRFWLVDPLDGTKEFISGSDEYTVNIAIVTDGVPIFGVITAPTAGIAWRGIVGRGADRLPIAGGKITAGTIHSRSRPAEELTAMVSRSHLDERTKAFIARFPRARLMQCGSSVKFCRLAEGAADLYPRLAPTHDWDIAAGHAIVTAAGGKVAAPDGSPLAYGTAELLIPAFLAWGDPAAAQWL
jgi:3'(2'), 5'-bisphosphate nucleotidase